MMAFVNNTRQLRSSWRHWMLAVGTFALFGAGCARLGPIAGATMASSTPSRGHRPGAEMSWGLVGGYYLSQSVEDVAPTNTLVSQASIWFDPGTLIGDASGLGIGARMIGGSDAIYEPMLKAQRMARAIK